jgi:hypothetical protein
VGAVTGPLKRAAEADHVIHRYISLRLKGVAGMRSRKAARAPAVRSTWWLRSLERCSMHQPRRRRRAQLSSSNDGGYLPKGSTCSSVSWRTDRGDTSSIELLGLLYGASQDPNLSREQVKPQFFVGYWRGTDPNIPVHHSPRWDVFQDFFRREYLSDFCVETIA